MRPIAAASDLCRFLRVVLETQYALYDPVGMVRAKMEQKQRLAALLGDLESMECERKIPLPSYEEYFSDIRAEAKSVLSSFDPLRQLRMDCCFVAIDFRPEDAPLTWLRDCSEQRLAPYPNRDPLYPKTESWPDSLGSGPSGRQSMGCNTRLRSGLASKDRVNCPLSSKSRWDVGTSTGRPSLPSRSVAMTHSRSSFVSLAEDAEEAFFRASVDSSPSHGPAQGKARRKDRS